MQLQKYEGCGWSLICIFYIKFGIFKMFPAKVYYLLGRVIDTKEF